MCNYNYLRGRGLTIIKRLSIIRHVSCDIYAKDNYVKDKIPKEKYIDPNEKLLKRNSLYYIIEASMEYLIAILVSGFFLANLTKELGFTDSLTGIITSIASLACIFQLFSMFVYRKRVKGFVTVLSIANQVLFMLLYVIPLLGWNKNLKAAIFFITVFVAYVIFNIAHPKKISWLMSQIKAGNRGRFTASKEVVSLVLGIGFTYGMGALIDYFKDRGEVATAFILAAITICVISLIHTLSLVFSSEKPLEIPQKKHTFKSMVEVLKDKNVIRVSVTFVLWNMAIYSTIPFYGSYQISELGFSLKMVSALAIVSSIARILTSRLWGAYADKKGFALMIRLCFGVMALGFLCNVFPSVALQRQFFVVYLILQGVAFGGINSALINLVFEQVSTDKYADALAISQTLAGLSGFFTTLLVSVLVSAIQRNGNSLWGIPMYAQQLTSFIAFFLTCLTLIYVHITLCKHRD